MNQPAKIEPAELLDRRPEANTFKVEDLLDHVRQGRMRIPPFQRGLRWKPSDAVDLLDSIYRGYPVGTLLFWETRAEAGEVRLGSVLLVGRARSDAWWVVDGQQRIASLVRSFLGAPHDRDEFALLFDLEAGAFVTPAMRNKLGASHSRFLPLSEVLDSERLMQWVFAHVPDDMARRTLVFNLGKRLREYEIPVYIVRTGSEQTMREIFGRSNRTGKRLKDSEVFDALNGVRSGGRPASIGHIVTELAMLQFGLVDEKLLYRLLRVLQGADLAGHAGKSPPRLSDDDANQLYGRTASVARQVIEFLMVDAHIPHFALLPYKQPFVTLGKFFDLHRTPSPRSRELLTRWLWRGALSGAHSGDTVSTRRVLDAITAGDESGSVQRMLVAVESRSTEVPGDKNVFNFRHATSKLEALVLMDMAPRHLQTGEVLNLIRPTGGVSTELSLLFPQICKAAKLDRNDRYLTVANRVAHPMQVGLKRLLAQVSDAAVLLSHGIDGDAAVALKAGRVDEFLDRRGRYIARHGQMIFNTRARMDDSDRPAISELMIADEAA